MSREGRHVGHTAHSSKSTSLHQQRDMREPQLLHTPEMCVPLTAGRQGLVTVMQLLVQPGKGLWPQSAYPSPFPLTKSLPEARTPTPPPQHASAPL